MKSNYLLTIELISKNKFTKGEIEGIKDILDLGVDNTPFRSIFNDSLSINFNSYLEVYAEDIIFDADVQDELGNLIENIDSIIPGGWENDSKIEWVSEYQRTSSVWYKDGQKWISVIKENDRGILGEDEEWNEDSGDSYGSYDDYDEDSW
jgi:hypothetical protein